MARIAIVIPAFNCVDTIGEAVSTSLAQTYSDIEVLVVDDGSTDGTHHAALRAADGDSRLRVLRQENAGIANALNFGLSSLAKSTEFIARMDGDDLMLPSRLALQVAFLDANPDISVVSGRVRTEILGKPLEHDGMLKYVNWLNGHSKPEHFARSIFIESPLCHPATTIRRSALEAVGGYHDMPWTEDYDLWMRLHLAGYTFAAIPEDVLVWRDHVQRVTRTHAKCAPMIFYDLKAHFLSQVTDRVRIWNAGRDGKRLARSLAAEKVEIHSFIDIDPKKIGGVRRGSIPVVSNESLKGPGDGPLIVVAVGIPRVRPEIRTELEAKGYIEGRDFLFAA
jgi:glycosyltransferase involved in cell wall biosynthesis